MRMTKALLSILLLFVWFIGLESVTSAYDDDDDDCPRIIFVQTGQPGLGGAEEAGVGKPGSAEEGEEDGAGDDEPGSDGGGDDGDDGSEEEDAENGASLSRQRDRIRDQSMDRSDEVLGIDSITLAGLDENGESPPDGPGNRDEKPADPDPPQGNLITRFVDSQWWDYFKLAIQIAGRDTDAFDTVIGLIRRSTSEESGGADSFSDSEVEELRNMFGDLYELADRQTDSDTAQQESSEQLQQLTEDWEQQQYLNELNEIRSRIDELEEQAESE